MSRRRAREMALRILFQVDLGKIAWQTAFQRAIEEEDLSKKGQEFLKKIVSGTLENLEQIDQMIANAAVDWSLERMMNTDRNILRFAVYELTACPDIPVSVTVNEAVELAKIYGDEDSGKFVNGILGRIIREADIKKEEKNEPDPSR